MHRRKILELRELSKYKTKSEGLFAPEQHGALKEGQRATWGTTKDTKMSFAFLVEENEVSKGRGPEVLGVPWDGYVVQSPGAIPGFPQPPAPLSPGPTPRTLAPKHRLARQCRHRCLHKKPATLSRPLRNEPGTRWSVPVFLGRVPSFRHNGPGSVHPATSPGVSGTDPKDPGTRFTDCTRPQNKSHTEGW